MRFRVRHGGGVRCDIAGCTHSLVTYSIASFIRQQAEHVGWARLKLNMLVDWKNLGRGSDGRKKLDVCPGHATDIRRGYGERRVQELKDKAAAKLANDAEKIARRKNLEDRRQRKLAERAERAADRVAFREAREVRRRAPASAVVNAEGAA